MTSLSVPGPVFFNPFASIREGLQFIRALQANFISVWPQEAYASPVTHVRIGVRDMFTANTPALARHVLLDNVANYHKSPVARRLFKPALGEGLLTSEGAVWKRHRQMVAPAFAQRQIAGLVPAMVEQTQRALDGWARHGGSHFDLTEALSAITLDIITRTMFGADSLEETVPIAADTAAYQAVLRPSLLDFLGAPPWVPRPGGRAARRIGTRLDAMIARVIARRRRNASGRDDLLTLLLAAVDHDNVSAREIRDEIATMFTAGQETSATCLAWTLYLLDRHPDITARLVAEIDQVLGGRPPQAAALEHLVFTRRVIEESLRLYPPAHSMTRVALGPDRLNDVAVPAGAVIVISPWLLHRNPTLWPDPERFDPDRAPAERFAFIPFGAGPRICIGAGFAMAEIMVVLAMLLQRWRLLLTNAETVEPLALITMRPSHNLRARIHARGEIV